jgi:outer membrane protein TolC
MLNRLPVVLARINEDISLTQFEEAMRNLAKEVEVAYWDLYCSYWTVETARAGRDSALKVWRVANARLQNNVGESAVEAQALAQVHQFDALLSAALNGVNLPGGDPGVKGRERRLRYLMGLSATDGQLLRPVDKPTIAHTEFDWASIQGETLNRNLDLRSQRWVIKQRELELISAKNQILPDVNISGLYRWAGVGDDWLGNDGGEEFPGIDGGANLTSAWESLLGGRYQEVGMRLELTPNAFGARRALAGIRAARLSMAREHEILREKENAAIYALSNELSLMESHYQQMQFKLNQWMASERETKVYSDKAEIGAQGLEQIVDLLLRAQERRARAQQEYYRAVCEYNKSIIQIHLLKGSLLEYNNIELAEGDWPQKAYYDAQQAALRQAAGIPLGSGPSRPSSVSRGTMPTDQFGPAIQGDLEGEVIIDQGEWVEGAVGTPEATEAIEGATEGAVESIELSSPAMEPIQPSASDAPAPSPPLQIGSSAPWGRSTAASPARDKSWSRRAGSVSPNIDQPQVLPANALRGGK